MSWQDLVIHRRNAGSYAASIDESWVVMTVPQGGLVMALAAEAMAAELDDPSQTLRSITAVFAAPVEAGDVDIAVTALRRGRSMSQLSATVRSPERDAGVHTLAVFGGPRRGFDFTEAVPPAAPPPLECWSYREMPSDWHYDGPWSPFWTNVVDGRSANGWAPWETPRPGPAESIAWYRFDQSNLLPAEVRGRAIPIILSDCMPTAVEWRVGSNPDFFAPSADLTVHLLAEPQSEWLLSHVRCTFAGDGYASATANLWDMHAAAEPRLVATATQVMLFTFL
jgi:acyl-CoA thioesterase